MAPLSASQALLAPADPILYSFEDKDSLSKALAEFVIKAQDEAIARRKRFSMATSGGSLPAMLAKYLVNRTDDRLRWDKWDIWFCDERLVPLDDKESNYWICQEEFFSKVPELKRSQIHTINDKILDDAEEVADEYEKELAQAFSGKSTVRNPVFDLILLGMGPDGHTASLFPHHPLLAETDRWVAPIEDSPKPPPRRVTFTYPVLNHAHRIAFVLAGEGKQELLSKTLEHPELGLPASRVRPVPPGDLYFFTDHAASAKTQYTRTQFTS